MYYNEVLAELVKQFSKIFGRKPTVFEYLSFLWQIRKFTYQKLLDGLVIINIELYNIRLMEKF